MLVARHAGGVGYFPRTEISKFHITRYQFAKLKIELTILLAVISNTKHSR